MIKDDIVELCVLIHSAEPDYEGTRRWLPILGLFRSVVVALTYLRRNHVQQELAEYYGVSQSTISRAITTVTPRLARVVAGFTPTAEELPRGEHLIVDGTLAGCWTWAGHQELYSGKHRTTGSNLQVVCDLAGRLRWISDPVDGSRHDSAALRESGVLERIDPAHWIGDKGYLGLGMITPIRKPPHRDLLDWEKEFNTAINRIRWKIEQTIANLKTWRILHRLPATTIHLPPDHHRGHRPTILQTLMNKPQCFILSSDSSQCGARVRARPRTRPRAGSGRMLLKADVLRGQAAPQRHRQGTVA